MKKTYLVVGAGLSGMTIARELADAGHYVDIVDKRDHIGGNIADYIDENGIRVHQYGPHIFHTNNEDVFNYLSRFTEWIPYRHKVKALVNGQFLTFPPNAETKEIIGADNVVDTFYRPYTEKMWGKPLEEVAPNILARVPGRDDNIDEYFPNDKYQFLPKLSYYSLAWQMVNHENIHVYINEAFDKSSEINYNHVFNSQPIDEYYDYCFGHLEYRSIKFHTFTIPTQRKILPVPTVNYTDKNLYTRITEWQNYPGHGTNNSVSTITLEEPCDYKENNFERYYPINDAINKKRYSLYKEIENEKVTFIGRTGLYVYINMDMAVNSAKQIATRFLCTI